MPDLQRLRDFTERYPHFQGLRLVPLGIPFLLSAVWPEAQLHRVPESATFEAEWRFTSLFAIALLFSFEIGRDYRERFGYVQPVRNMKTRLWVGVYVIGAYLFAILWAENHSDEFSFTAAVIGIALAYVGSRGGEIRLHYDACAILALAFSSLGAFGVPFRTRDILLDGLIGFGLVIIGVGDHLVLRGAMEPETQVDAAWEPSADSVPSPGDTPS
jgi:hypothetical protein